MTARRRSGTTESRAYRTRYAERHPEDPRHGTLTFYKNWGCLCDRCRATGADERSRLKLAEQSEHEPSVDRILEHRAFGEKLCSRCKRFLRMFKG